MTAKATDLVTNYDNVNVLLDVYGLKITYRNTQGVERVAFCLENQELTALAEKMVQPKGPISGWIFGSYSIFPASSADGVCPLVKNF